MPGSSTTIADKLVAATSTLPVNPLDRIGREAINESYDHDQNFTGRFLHARGTSVCLAEEQNQEESGPCRSSGILSFLRLLHLNRLPP